jgi:hypothetical protein
MRSRCYHFFLLTYWKITPWRLFATGYLVHSQLPSISGGRSSFREFQSLHDVTGITYFQDVGWGDTDWIDPA